MWKIPRPSEPGVYDLNLFEGEQITGVTFSNINADSFNILTNTGKLFVIGTTDDGNLTAAVIDLSDIAGQLPN